jgi:hypothetical protein
MTTYDNDYFIGEVVSVNFGMDPFRFDISQYYRDEKLRLMRSVSSTVLPPQSVPSTATVNSLIVEYLVRQGYHETALSLYDTSIKQLDELDETVSLLIFQVRMELKRENKYLA